MTKKCKVYAKGFCLNLDFEDQQVWSWLNDADVEALSSGAVLTPDTFHHETFLPVAHGLFCEKIFGPLDDTVLRSERFGHIEFPVPIQHPLRLEDDPRALLNRLLVVPPQFRNMRRMEDGNVVVSDLNALYRNVIHQRNRLARLLELNAPSVVVDKESAALLVTVEALFSNPQTLRTLDESRPLLSLTDHFVGSLQAAMSAADAPANLADNCDELLSLIGRDTSQG